MKKQILLSAFMIFLTGSLLAQADKYPVPEYSNEIYLIKKDSSITLMRLEKGTSKQEMKVKMMGMGGMDQGYSLDGERSTVRLTSGNDLVFLLYTGRDKAASSPQADSAIRAAGMDPSMLSMSSMMDPNQNISLYSMKSEKGLRKALTQSMGLMGKSKKTATKYTLSIKKPKDGYFEMKVDKSLPKGEYTFVMMSMSADQSYSLFAFAID
jgi:hypothetical protein